MGKSVESRFCDQLVSDKIVLQAITEVHIALCKKRLLYSFK